VGPFLYQGEHFISVDMMTTMGDGFDDHLALGGDTEAT
jgi:hypothetical protein